MFIAPTSSRLWTVTLWLSLLGFTWSLPVLSYLHIQRERAEMQSGRYYTAKEVPNQDWRATSGGMAPLH